MNSRCTGLGLGLWLRQRLGLGLRFGLGLGLGLELWTGLGLESGSERTLPAAVDSGMKRVCSTFTRGTPKPEAHGVGILVLLPA